jgi:predicted nucleic acid-binding protein
MRSIGDSPIHLSAVALGEFAQGFPEPENSFFEQLSSLFHLLVLDRPIALHYARINRHLRMRGTLIGSNDLWIAATALEHSLPLVTRDIDHFRRIPDLQLIGY